MTEEHICSGVPIDSERLLQVGELEGDVRALGAIPHMASEVLVLREGQIAE